MIVEEVTDPAELAERGASIVAGQLRDLIRERRRAVLALSGGSTPAATLERLATKQVPWHAVHVVQVDERVARLDDDARNFAMLRRTLLSHVAPASVWAMPVESDDLEAAALDHDADLRRLGAVDVAVLGLGDDGHTASLIPGDPVLDVTDRWVAATGDYRGARRMTLTAPALSTAAHHVTLVQGASKIGALKRLLSGDGTDPASLVMGKQTVVVADSAARGA